MTIRVLDLNREYRSIRIRFIFFLTQQIMQVRPLWNQHNILEKIWFLKSTYKASSNFLESPYIIFEKMCDLQDFLIGRASAAIVYRHFNFKQENYWNAWLGMGSAIGETTSVNTFSSIDYGVIFIVFLYYRYKFME